MTEPDPDRVRSVVGRALELDAGERDAFVARECVGDPALLERVRTLLARAERTRPEFLERPEAPASGGGEGMILGEFEIQSELGRGGMGVVYRARQLTLDREVAVKVLVEGLTTTEREVERFHREARAAARLHHPGIVRVLTDGRVGRTHWFAMELVDGHDLRREIRLERDRARLAGERPLLPAPGEPGNVAAVARVCAEAAEALQHAHDAGLVHRDVNPANLLLARDGHVLVGDFGLVRDEALGSLTRTGEVAGTPHYMSPEQARVSKGKVDHRTDVYSLGVVLYELATLRRPFEGASSAEILSKIRDREPAPVRALNPAVPRDLAVICAKAMAKDPDRRYRSAGEMGEDLRRFLRHEAIVAQPPSWADRVRRWVRSHRRPVLGVSLVLVGLAVGVSATGWWAAGRELARVGVSLRSLAGQPLRGRVSACPLDRLTGEVGPAQELGRLPLRGVRIRPGWWRLRVEVDGGDVLELERDLLAGGEVQVSPLPARRRPGTEAMVRVEGGTLSLHDENQPLVSLNGRDVVVQSFWLDACEVSNADYRRFLEETGHAQPPQWGSIEPGVHDDLPVVGVSWLDARDYAEWMGKRLPTYAEWAWAARGPEGRIYPWPDPVRGELRGNTTKPRDSISNAGDVPFYLRFVAPVRSFPEARTASGIYHLFGNVAEWTGSPLAQRTSTGFEPRPSWRIVAGFAWDAGTRNYTLEYLAFEGIESSYANTRIGFRCARSE